MAKWFGCWIPNLGVPGSKTLGDSMVDSAFDPSSVNQMNIRNSWDLVAQRKLSPYCGSVA